MLAEGAKHLLIWKKYIFFLQYIMSYFVTDLNLQDQAWPYMSQNTKIILFSDNSMIQWFIADIELVTARPSPKFRDELDVFWL